jgi:hypothetical protein
MAVERRQQFLGQARIDAPHLRAIESGVSSDFDVLAGIIMAGKKPVVIQGFDLVLTNAVSNDAENLILNVAGGAVLHYEATESGSVFRVPEGRAQEVLGPTNPRVEGSFTPSAVNFVGLDLLRSADDSTADTVQFLDPDTDTETPVIVPLARTLNYSIVISTKEFTSTPGILPLARITTNSLNKVSIIEDARHLFFRLGQGGTNPSAVSPYGWPGGRNEAASTLSTIAGDRSIGSLKTWCDAVMTRLWEIGGGEYWYSATADRNVSIGHISTVFASTGEAMEYTGGHLHWQALRIIFDNSTGAVNEVQAQTTNLAGLTDIADGECIYVDLDRTRDRTIAFPNPLVAQKGVLKTLGQSTRPGQRFIIAWRIGASVFFRGQPYPVGSSLKLATPLASGTGRTSIQASGHGGSVFTPQDPVFAGLAMHTNYGFTATAGGISHNLDISGANQLVTAADLKIGRGSAAGDYNVLITTIGAQYQTLISGTSDFEANGTSVLEVQNPSVSHTAKPKTRLATFRGYDGAQVETSHFFESIGSIGIRNIDGNVTPPTPTPTGTEDVRSRFYIRHNGVASPNRRDQLCVLWHNGDIVVIAEGPLY